MLAISVAECLGFRSIKFAISPLFVIGLPLRLSSSKSLVNFNLHDLRVIFIVKLSNPSCNNTFVNGIITINTTNSFLYLLYTLFPGNKKPSNGKNEFRRYNLLDRNWRRIGRHCGWNTNLQTILNWMLYPSQLNLLNNVVFINWSVRYNIRGWNIL